MIYKLIKMARRLLPRHRFFFWNWNVENIKQAVCYECGSISKEKLFWKKEKGKEPTLKP